MKKLLVTLITLALLVPAASVFADRERRGDRHRDRVERYHKHYEHDRRHVGKHHRHHHHKERFYRHGHRHNHPRHMVPGHWYRYRHFNPHRDYKYRGPMKRSRWFRHERYRHRRTVYHHDDYNRLTVSACGDHGCFSFTIVD